MNIAGWQKVSMVDYPGNIATVIFTKGCNYNCYYCHNRELIPLNNETACIAPEEVLSYLNKRKGLVDGLVVSGGEPTLQAGLSDFLKNVRNTGILIKLDTNGSRPDVLKNLLDENLLDYVAMDIKAPFQKAGQISKGIHVEHIKESIRIITDHAPDYEFRTTVAPLLTRDDLIEIASYIKGAKRYALQQYKKPDNGFSHPRLSDEEHAYDFFESVQSKLEPFVQQVVIRGF